MTNLFADGPNPYAYLHHRPLMACDAYGLYEEGYAYRDLEMSGFGIAIFKKEVALWRRCFPCLTKKLFKIITFQIGVQSIC